MTRYFLQAGYDVIVIWPPGGASGFFYDGFWKSDHDFLIVFHSNILSGMHGFRDNEVLLLTGYDVIVVSRLGFVFRLIAAIIDPYMFRHVPEPWKRECSRWNVAADYITSGYIQYYIHYSLSTSGTWPPSLVFDFSSHCSVFIYVLSSSWNPKTGE